MKLKTALLITLLTLVAHPISAEVKEIRLTGATTSIRYKQLRPGQTVTLFGISKGNSSAPVKLSVNAPNGTRLTTSAAKVRGTVTETLRRESSFYNLPLRTAKDLASADKSCVTFAPGESFNEEDSEFNVDNIVSSWDPICESYSESELSELGHALGETYGGDWPRERVCGYIVSIYRGGSGEGELQRAPRLRTAKHSARNSIIRRTTTSDYSAVLNKNACSQTTDEYIFRVRLKLPRSIPSSGFLRVRVQDTKRYGGTQATIKPISEGRFAPDPLLLMNYLSFCGQRISFVRWEGDKPISSSPALVYDLIAYRGMVLTRTPISRYLTGGFATVQIFNRHQGYGTCFELKRERQRVNGYPS